MGALTQAFFALRNDGHAPMPATAHAELPPTAQPATKAAGASPVNATPQGVAPSLVAAATTPVASKTLG